MKKKLFALLLAGLLTVSASAMAFSLNAATPVPDTVNGSPRADFLLPIDDTGGKEPDPKGFKGLTSYEDPTISVQITHHTMNPYLGYWEADIKIQDASQLRTAAAGGTFKSSAELNATYLSTLVNAVFAFTGDNYVMQKSVYLLRQGALYKNDLDGSRDILLVDAAGDFHIIEGAKRGDIPAAFDGNRVINAISFGPALVINGKQRPITFNYSIRTDELRRRIALCQVDALTYKVVVTTGNTNSHGMTLYEFSDLIASLGVQTAYNLDGGDSAIMVLGGKKVNEPELDNIRNLYDIIYFASAWEGEGK